MTEINAGQPVDVNQLVAQAGPSVGAFEVCPKCGAAIIDGLCACPKEEPAPKEDSQAKEEEKPADAPQTPMELLSQIPGAPSKDQVNAWKQSYQGGVYILALGPKDVFIWRYITHAEWLSIVSNGDISSNEMALQEAIVNRCLLWPKFDPIRKQMSRAGLQGTLFNVIMKGSYFLEVPEAMNLVYEL